MENKNTEYLEHFLSERGKIKDLRHFCLHALLCTVFFSTVIVSDVHAVGMPSLESNENESVDNDEKLQIITSLFLLLIVGIGCGICEYFRRNRKKE